MGFFSDLFNPGKKHIKRATRALDRATFTGGTMSGPGGLRAGFSFDDEGRLSSSQSLGQFQPFLNQLFGLTGDAFQRASTGVDELGALLAPNLDAFQGVFDTASGIAGMDPLARGQQVTDLMRQRARSGAQNLVNSTFDRLFASGGLSNQVTREQTTESMRRQLADEDAGFQLAGMQFGESSVANAFARMLGSSQAQQGQLGFLENLRSTAMNQGFSALGNAQGLSMLPMNLMQMIAGLQAQRSGTELNIAAGHLGNAQSAESTFMNFMNFMGEQVKMASTLSNGGYTSGGTG